MSTLSVQCTHCGRYIRKEVNDPPLHNTVFCNCDHSIPLNSVGLTARVCSSCKMIVFLSSPARSYAVCPSCSKPLFKRAVSSSDYHTCKECGQTTILDPSDQKTFLCPVCEEQSPVGIRQDFSGYRKTDLPTWLRYLILIAADVGAVLCYKALAASQSLRPALLWLAILLAAIGAIGVFKLSEKQSLRIKEIVNGGFFCTAFCMAFAAYPLLRNNEPAYTFLWYIAMLLILLNYYGGPYTFSSRSFLTSAILQMLLFPAAATVFVGVLSIPMGDMGTLWEAMNTLLIAALLLLVFIIVIVGGLGAVIGGSQGYDPYAEYGKQTGHGRYVDGKYFETYATFSGRETLISSDGEILRQERNGSDIYYDSNGKAYIGNTRAPYHDRTD